MVKGWLAVFFKAIPQLAPGLQNVHVGRKKWPLGRCAHWPCHHSLARLGQLWFSIKEAGWDRNRRGSALSELANEASWLVATLVWLLV